VAPSPALSQLESTLRRLARDLAELNCRWALVGALAVSARTEPRFTRDIDVAVAVADDEEAERLVRELQSRRYLAQAVVEQEATHRLATVRFIPPGNDATGIVLDALFASSGIEPEIVAEAETLELLSDLRIPVATVGHLIALKLLARDDESRPQDRIDLVALGRVATDTDLDRTRTAIALIEKRGFHRGKRLAAELERLLRSGQP
jgi:predicted nucleotidyltransferase